MNTSPLQTGTAKCSIQFVASSRSAEACVPPFLGAVSAGKRADEIASSTTFQEVYISNWRRRGLRMCTNCLVPECRQVNAGADGTFNLEVRAASVAVQAFLVIASNTVPLTLAYHEAAELQLGTELSHHIRFSSIW
jgi:hypothetical protein